MTTDLERAKRRAVRAKADRAWLERCYRLERHLPARDVAMLCAMRGQWLRRVEGYLKPGVREDVEAELDAVLTELEANLGLRTA